MVQTDVPRDEILQFRASAPKSLSRPNENVSKEVDSRLVVCGQEELTVLGELVIREYARGAKIDLAWQPLISLNTSIPQCRIHELEICQSDDPSVKCVQSFRNV